MAALCIRGRDTGGSRKRFRCTAGTAAASSAPKAPLEEALAAQKGHGGRHIVDNGQRRRAEARFVALAVLASPHQDGLHPNIHGALHVVDRVVADHDAARQPALDVDGIGDGARAAAGHDVEEGLLEKRAARLADDDGLPARRKLQRGDKGAGHQGKAVVPAEVPALVAGDELTALVPQQHPRSLVQPLVVEVLWGRSDHDGVRLVRGHAFEL
mmetsp:Transcript_159135/g.510396  ORF Transcript_159135/g.510396 Transcript_159135/m.510396 type:complete len:213 (+) Transcript_159135:162-800(+)